MNNQAAPRISDVRLNDPVFTELNLRHKQFWKTLVLYGFLILYRILVDVNYAYVAEIYAYQNLFFIDRSSLSYIISWVIFVIALPIFTKILLSSTASGNILSLLIIFSVVPTISTISYRSDYDIDYLLLISLYWFMIFFCWLIIKPITIPQFNKFETDNFQFLVMLILCASVIIYSYINTGIRFHFSIIDVYDLRSEARLFNAPFPLNYLVSLADNLLPFFVVYGLYRKKWILSAIVLFIVYINFSIAGTKQIVFTMVFGIAGFFFVKKFSDSYRLIAAANILLILSIIEELVFKSSAITNIFGYRVLFIPAELHYAYYSYFQINDFLYFSQSIFKWIWQGSNNDNIQFLIGEYTIGEYSARANNGLFSDAYMNFGIIGVILFPLFICLYLRLVDGAVSGIPERVLFVIVIYIAFVLLGMTLTSALFTSGLLFLIPFLYSLPRQRQN